MALPTLALFLTSLMLEARERPPVSVRMRSSRKGVVCGRAVVTAIGRGCKDAQEQRWIYRYPRAERPFRFTIQHERVS